MNTSTQRPTDEPVDLSRSRILFIDDQDLDVQILQALATLQQPMQYLCISEATELLTQLHHDWDLIIFGQCQALTLSKSLQHIQEIAPFRIPVLIALPRAPQSQDLAHFLSMIRHGVFDLLRIDQVEHIQASLLRALKYSRALQHASQIQLQLEQTQKLNQLLQLQLKHARALIQDGVHIQVNLAYLRLFGLDSASEILGELFVDVLQPQHRAEFEQQIKQLALENQAWNHIRIHSLNPQLRATPELDLICIAQPNTENVEIYILPTALLQTLQQQPDRTQRCNASQYLSAAAADQAANDQHYADSRTWAPSSKPASNAQSSIQVTALKQLDFDISQLNLPSSAILDLSAYDLPQLQALTVYFQQLYSQHPPHLRIVVVSTADTAQQHSALERAAQQPFHPVDPQQLQDAQNSAQPIAHFKLEALRPEQSFIQRLIQSIQVDRELLNLSCQQLADLDAEQDAEQAPCMLMLQLQHHILLHDPDFAHMLIHRLSELKRHQPVLILEFDAPALLLNSDQALKRLALLRQCGVLIALRNARPSADLNAFIQATAISLLSFDNSFNNSYINSTLSETCHKQLQQLRKIGHFKVLIKHLNQQTSFERAQALELDYLQGDYFQAKHKQLRLIEQALPH